MKSKKETCPHCGGTHISGLGSTTAGSKRRLCRGCGKSWTLNPKSRVPEVVRIITQRLLAEDVPVPVVVKAVENYASRRWVYRQKGAVR